MKKIHWWEDSSGRKTCHENTHGASFNESFLGELFTDGTSFYFRLSGSSEMVGPYERASAAAADLEMAVGGRKVNEWD